MKAIDENLELLKRHPPLYLINRTGNCTSSHNAAEHINKAIDLCRGGGFKKILTIRGDTDFSQTKHVDRWGDQNVKFVFGIEYSHGTHRWMCFSEGSKCCGIHCDVENDRLYNIYPFPTASDKFPITISSLS